MERMYAYSAVALTDWFAAICCAVVGAAVMAEEFCVGVVITCPDAAVVGAVADEDG